MRFESVTAVDKPPAEVFAIYADVVGWPRWTASITSIELLDGDTLRVGSHARVRQPKLPVAVWEVTELVPGRSFVWESRAPGIVSIGRHIVEPRAGGGCAARGILDQTGPLGLVAGAVYGSLIRRYLAMETAGLSAFATRPS